MKGIVIESDIGKRERFDCAHPANEQALIDLEKAVTEAYKNKKADVFRNTWRRTMLVLTQMEPRK